MLKKKKESVNYLDQIPRISIPKWEVLEDGLVEVTVENKGFFNVIAQKCFHRPRTSYIKLDEYGSCVFQQIDGEKSIYEIGQILEQTHEGASNSYMSGCLHILRRFGDCIIFSFTDCSEPM